MSAPGRRLAEHCQDRLGEGLRAVGHHSETSFGITYLRDDLKEEVTTEMLKPFIASSRSVQQSIAQLEGRYGEPEVSTHLLEDGFLIQFYSPEGDVIFLSIERYVGRDFTEFIGECREVMF